MAGKRKSYDDKFRASAVVMLEAAGYPSKKGALMQVAGHIGVPHPTLSRWFNAQRNPPPNDVVQEKRQELSLRLEDLAHKLVDMACRIADNADTDTSIQQVATSVGIVVDKWQLLKGKPTDRHEIVDNSTRAERINSILERGRTRRAGQSDSDGELIQ